MGKPKAPKSTQTTNQTQTSTPWAPATGALEDMIKQAQAAYNATPKTPGFTGPNADQSGAVNMVRNYATGGMAGSGADAIRALAQKTATGGGTWNADINPYVQGAITAAINPLRDQLDSNVLSIGDAAKLAGAYGGDRGDLLKGVALSRFNRDAMDVGSQISFSATEAERQRAFQSQEAAAQRALSAASLFQDADSLALDPARLLAGIGDQQMTWDQAANAAAVDAPWAGLDRLSTILGGLSPYGTTTTQGTTTTTGKPGGGGLQGGLSGALGGASAGSAFGPWGAAIGGVVGGLGGLFG
jgi:hypothetical protein